MEECGRQIFLKRFGRAAKEDGKMKTDEECCKAKAFNSSGKSGLKGRAFNVARAACP
jgi:hypothetical protein